MTHSPNTPWRGDNVVLPKHDVLHSKPGGQTSWPYLEGRGGNSKYVDKEGAPLQVPQIGCWRPRGWPPLHLSYVRRCGQPDEEKLAEIRLANSARFDRILTDEIGELIERSSLGAEEARALRARGASGRAIEDLSILEHWA